MSSIENFDSIVKSVIKSFIKRSEFGKKKYNTDFFSYLFFSCVVHTTTGFDNDYPNNKYIKYTIFVHMIVVFVLLFIL